MATLMWIITLNPDIFVKLENSRLKLRWFVSGKNPNKKWMTRIIKDEECECKSSYFYIFMAFYNVSMLIIQWRLLIITYELPKVTSSV
ncbi:unnamed protein product [Malus baccata var. baccata]